MNLPTECEYCYICDELPSYRKSCKGEPMDCERRRGFLSQHVPKQPKLFKEADSKCEGK
jgi:hypothetical protein